MDAKIKADDSKTVQFCLQECPAIRDVLMFIEMYGLCFQYFPLVRTEIPEAHNKYIKREMKKGLVRQCSHHQAIINRSAKTCVNLVFSRMTFGNFNSIMRQNDLVDTINRECANLAGTLFDPSLLDLQQAMKKYAINFGRLFVLLVYYLCLKILFVYSFSGHSQYDVYKPFEHVHQVSIKQLKSVLIKGKNDCTDSVLNSIPTRQQLIHTVNTTVKNKWRRKFQHAAPTGDHVVNSIINTNGDWKLIPALSICHTNNGFCSGVVSVGDCVWITKPNREHVIIQLSHVCFTQNTFRFWF